MSDSYFCGDCMCFKLQFSFCVYFGRHDWSTVTTAFWGKYPNQNAPHVKEIDTYERNFSPVTGDITSKRILKCISGSIPSWMGRLGFPTTMFAELLLCIVKIRYCQEESVVNAREKKLVLRSSNISGSGLMVVEETCSYSAHPENSNWFVLVLNIFQYFDLWL